MPDPTVASLDIETYGSCERNWKGDALPRQTVFHPRRSLLTDHVSLDDLILSCSLTYPLEDPRWSKNSETDLSPSTPTSPSRNSPTASPATNNATTISSSSATNSSASSMKRQSWNGSLLSALQPGLTMVFLLHLPEHRRMLAAHLSRLDTILSHNIAFDILMKRALSDFRDLLTERITLIDSSILGFIHSELRPEKSLKDLGPVLSTYLYQEKISLKDGQRYPSPLDDDFQNYNAQDTCNSMSLTARLAFLIERDFPGSPKLSPLAISHWSSQLWSAVRMGEAGIPMNRSGLEGLSKNLSAKARLHNAHCLEHGLLLDGKGSPASKTRFIASCFKRMDTPANHLKLGISEKNRGGKNSPRSLYEHPAVGITDVKAEVSSSILNRVLAQQLLPKDDPHQPVIASWLTHTESHGIISKYAAPLLTGRRAKKHKSPFDTLLLPTPGASRFWQFGLNPHVQITYPKWFITPSPYKDDSGGSGGQKQGRPSAQAPQAQQWPDPIRTHIASRFDDGIWGGGDLSQIEMRVPALLSGDASLVAAFHNGLDLHGERARFIFGADIDKDPHWKSGDMATDPRQWAKTFNFEDLYRAGAQKMQQVLLEDAGRLFPLDFFYDVINSRRLLRAGLMEWQDRLLYTARKDGYLILPFTGHSRYFEPGGKDTDKPNEIVNFPVQCTAALVLSFILQYILAHPDFPKLHHRDPPILFCMNWYDALWFDYRKSFAPTIRGIYAEAVTHVEQRGYWSQLQDLHQRHIPLKYEWKEPK